MLDDITDCKVCTNVEFLHYGIGGPESNPGWVPYEKVKDAHQELKEANPGVARVLFDS